MTRVTNTLALVLLLPLLAACTSEDSDGWDADMLSTHATGSPFTQLWHPAS